MGKPSDLTKPRIRLWFRVESWEAPTWGRSKSQEHWGMSPPTTQKFPDIMHQGGTALEGECQSLGNPWMSESPNPHIFRWENMGIFVQKKQCEGPQPKGPPDPEPPFLLPHLGLGFPFQRGGWGHLSACIPFPMVRPLRTGDPWSSPLCHLVLGTRWGSQRRWNPTSAAFSTDLMNKEMNT